MIDRQRLLADLRGLMKRLERDLLERSRSAENPEIGHRLTDEHARARAAGRTTQSYEEWRDDRITQMAAAWTLSAVFARFLEDNDLIDRPRLAGPGDRLRRAQDERDIYFRANPTHTYRDYLLAVWDHLATLPGASELFGARNPLRDLPNWLSGDAAGELLRFFARLDSATGAPVHDFTDPTWDTRFLGDLYQDLSDEARKRYALLQTPIFVEEFILDRTLDPALDEFGLSGFRMIDPACGSGHFLLGAFARILDRWHRQEPGKNLRLLAQNALDSVCGVDLNPDALAIARFRLLLAALRACDTTRLAHAPDFKLNLACGDSLLHAPLQPGLGLGVDADDECDHAYATEDLQRLHRLLTPYRYHAVVANPPYITPKDPQLNARYRKRFISCHMKYALSVPFMEQLFRLAVRPATGTLVGAGYVGQITANSFMKREFGKKLVEQFLPTVDLTHVIDTAGAYIPGHGTPTVILFGRNRRSVASTVRAVLGIRGEPLTPDDPAKGQVWSAILAQTDVAGSKSVFISVANMQRAQFQKHPWSIGGGGSAELKARIESTERLQLVDFIESTGRSTHVGEDDVYYFSVDTALRSKLFGHMVPIVSGEDVRDYGIRPANVTIFPYDKATGEPVPQLSLPLWQHLWRFRVHLRNRVDFGRAIEQRGLRWYDHTMLFPGRYKNTCAAAYPEVSTLNHFVIVEHGMLFRQTAPSVYFKPDVSNLQRNEIALLLNSSIACFGLSRYVITRVAR